MEVAFDVRYAETDKMGVVHHSNYPIWFEVGRVELFKSLGLDYTIIEREGLFNPVIELNVMYERPAKFGDKVIVRTKIEEFKGVRIIFGYEVLNSSSKEIIVKGESHHVWTNLDFKPVNLKKHRPDIYEKITDFIEEY